MKTLLVSSFVLIILASCFVLVNHQASAVPVIYNQTAMVIPWITQARNSTTYDVFIESGYNGTITAWYHTGDGYSRITKMLGNGTTPITPFCVPNKTFNLNMTANGSKIYYTCGSVTGSLESTDISSLLHTHYFSDVGQIKSMLTLTAMRQEDREMVFSILPLWVKENLEK